MRDGVVLVVVGEDRQDRPEDLLLGDGHVVAHLGEHGRLHEVAVLEALGLAGAAGDELGALVDALLDVAVDPVDLGLARQRAEHGEVGEGVLRLELRLDLVGGDALGVGQLAGGHEHAGEGGAGLARVEVGLADAVADGRLEAGVVEVVEEDVGGLAAELEGDALEASRDAAAATALPARVEPVKDTMSTAGASRWPRRPRGRCR